MTPRDYQQRARTKIIATVGPACRDPDTLIQMARAGVDVFRLNMAHGNPADQQADVDSIRETAQRVGRPLAILVDLAGPKIRLGELVGDRVVCERDALFEFVEGAASQASNQLTSNYGPLVSELDVGDRLLLADGTVCMVVEEKREDCAVARVVEPGVIRSRQGINLPGVKISAPAISAVDRAHAIWAAQAGVDFIGLSFVRTPAEVRELKRIVHEESDTVRVVAKIEKREALHSLEEIVAAADAVMVARGDLGIEIDVAEMPVEQKRIIHTCQRLHKPAIIATQMLESMLNAPRPTRAEATDVANAILDGADACMLSGETAIGKFPLDTVAIMNRIAVATEASVRHRPPRDAERHKSAQLHDITRAVVVGAGAMAHQLDAKLVVVASHSGATALALSQQRHFVPTIGVSTSESTLRQMCLYWGVTPLAGAPAQDIEQLITYADRWVIEVGLASAGDRIVIVGGSHLTAGLDNQQMARGVHDIVIVHEVGS